jgi:imidazolonepropionase-like amidohydrolase
MASTKTAAAHKGKLMTEMSTTARRFCGGLISVLAALILQSCASGATTGAASFVVITGGSIVDPAGDEGARRADVLIRDDLIVAVGLNLAIPREAARIDASGQFLTPGLWDGHAHLAALTDVSSAPELYVGHGILSVRDMGGDPPTLYDLRRSIVAGSRIGPNVFLAGPTLNGQQSAPFHRVVRNGEEARSAVHELGAEEVDYIKVHRRMSRDALLAVIAEARALDLEVVGHVPLGMGWDEAAQLGMRSIEHIFTILENELSAPRDPAVSIEAAIARIDGRRGDLIFAAMASAGTYLCPTLVAFERSITYPPELEQAKRAGFAHFLAYVARAHGAGVQIVAGSDVATDPGPALLRELELLVEAGLSPREALRSATTTPAGLLHRPDLAAIAPGAQASLLILNADPTQDIRALRELNTVVLRGNVLRGGDLARLRTMAAPEERTPG